MGLFGFDSHWRDVEPLLTDEWQLQSEFEKKLGKMRAMYGLKFGACKDLVDVKVVKVKYRGKNKLRFVYRKKQVH